MRKVLIASSLMLLLGCAPARNGTDGKSCTITTTGNTKVIKCPDGSSTPISNGTNGTDGSNGSAGTNGHSIAFKELTADRTLCPAGGTALNLGLDVNNDNILQDSETTGVVITCNGVAGTNGHDGAAGAAGRDATPVTAVQFCSNYTTTYPVSFPEFGLCVNNNIYGVYWDGENSWLSQIPAGLYMSTATGAPCTFTVAANCHISH